jgi:hypothetical protein
MTNRPNASSFSHSTSSADRFALAPLQGAAVLLDLLTGGVYELNAGAAQICAAILDDLPAPAIQDRLAHSFRLDAATAARDVSAVQAQLNALAADTRVVKQPSLLEIEARDDGFTMSSQGTLIFRIAPDGCSLIWEPGAVGLGIEPGLLLKWVAPHLLALQHQPVLHASAVQQGDGVLAFSGYTGAGKTTLARTFAAQGAALISQDLLAIAVVRDQPVVYLDGETVLHRWASDQSARLVGSGSIEIDAAGLCDAVRGATLPLHDVLFIDPARRFGTAIAAEPMAPARALVCMLGHGFIELPQRDVWIEMLETGRAIVGASRVRSATIPDGLEALEAAARLYSTITAS